MRRLRCFWIPLVCVLAPAALSAQNIMLPPDSVETLLAESPFEIIDRRGSRFEGDRTSRVTLTYDDGTLIPAKWAPAPLGGEMFNNVPRFEVAAYELQKLFLEPSDYVVPPTVVRAFPLTWYRELVPRAEPTFRGTDDVLVALQYWLFNVTPDDVWDEDRFAADTAYARAFANFNIFTYLAHHQDENTGNYLISRDTARPVVFSVDNGITFSSDRGDRGHRWRYLRVDRVPAATVARLRALGEEELHRALGTVAEFVITPEGHLEAAQPGPPLDDGRGIRRGNGVIQLGLTGREIDQVWKRIEDLIEDVDQGRLEVF